MTTLTKTDKQKQNIINHVALLLDASSSMDPLTRATIRAADQLVAHLAETSREKDQETRVTIYSFAGGGIFDRRRGVGEGVTCLVYDKDVLRLPSIATLYKVFGNTPLLDATAKALDDLATTSEIYGDHSYLVYVLTDGEENCSLTKAPALKSKLGALAENWTVAALVPNDKGRRHAESYGFPVENIMVWDATSERGMEEAASVMRAVTSNYMTARSTGLRGTRNLFTLTTNNLPSTGAAVAKAGADAWHFGQYRLLSATRDMQISELIEQQTKRAYRLGEGLYHLVKPEKVQPQKKVALLDKKTKKLYTGDTVRKMLNLPDSYEVKVAPAQHPNFDIFIQSTSTNRKVLAGQNVLVLS
jgi:hypothetical protein